MLPTIAGDKYPPEQTTGDAASIDKLPLGEPPEESSLENPPRMDSLHTDLLDTNSETNNLLDSSIDETNESQGETRQKECKRPQERILQEFRLSAIPDRLTLSNVRYIEGDEAVEILAEWAIAKCQNVTSYPTEPAKRILKRYDFARAGGWAAWGTTLNGEQGIVPIVKPREPRSDFQKIGKTIKYETPAQAEALPILPYVDPETAALIYQRYGIEPIAGETFWQAVKRCNLPIAICEGLKKALACIAHGLPAIAVRGIAQWHKKGSDELHDVIATFATSKRPIAVIFDQDAKERTWRDVRLQRSKLAAALELQGSLPTLPQWDLALGKGIDDCLLSQGENAQAWFDAVIAHAPTLKAIRRDEWQQRAFETISRSSRLSYPVERATTGEYLPELPELEPGAIHVLSASMNAGKTTRIGKDWVQWAITQGWNVLVLAPLNSLGQQTAMDLDLPHIHSYGKTPDQQEALLCDISYRHGVVMCPDSLHRLPDWFFERPLLLVLDEANQVIEHIAIGNTLGSRWSGILEKFTATLRHAIATGAIVLAEDGIPDRAVTFVKTLSGGESVRVVTHQKHGIPWDCTVYRGQASGFRARFLQVLEEDGSLLFVSSSQKEGKRMERAIRERFSDQKVARIDSETNQKGEFTAFFECPDTWLETHQPDVLILSPSAKSGVSIQGGVEAENAYFAAVWGYFPTLTTDTHMQMLGRFRPSVPRVVFCPDFALSSGDESLLNPRAIKRRLQSNAKAIAGVYGLDDLLEAADDRSELMAAIETAVMDYLAQSLAVAGAQKSILHLSVVERLEKAGHSVTVETMEKDAAAAQLWKEIQEELWQEDAAAIAAAAVEPGEHTTTWASTVLESNERSLEDRLLARKVLWREEFPGVLFDCPEECYRALCEDYGAMRRGVRAQAKAENLEGTKEADRAATEAVLNGNVRALHRLPKNYAQAMLRSKSGVLELLNGNPYSNADPRAIAVKTFALHYAREISYFLRLTIKADQTPVEICHKLLAQLGLERDKPGRPGAIAAVGRPGKRGEQKDLVYAINVEFDPLRVRLLEAARRKLSESVSSTRIDQNLPLRVDDTAASLPLTEGIAGGQRVLEGRSLGDLVESTDGGEFARVGAVAGWTDGMTRYASSIALRAAA
ncbi:MAG: plasmid replication protein, CyRepA1 family [Leptolyngbya sp. BL-A-14]